MPVVPATFKNRVRRHLGYNRPRGVSPEASALLETAFNSIIDNDDIHGTKGPSIKTLLDRCDRLWKMTDPTEESVFSQFQQIIGDVNRQTRTTTIGDAITKNREAYYKATDDLAYFLNVPNLQRPDQARYIFHNMGDSYVFAPPGAADTCISDRIILSVTCA